MKIEQAKQLTEQALDKLIQALEAGKSEALRVYLAAVGRFHRYSWLCCAQHNQLNVYCPTM
jgi:hypothetical protein